MDEHEARPAVPGGSSPGVTHAECACGTQADVGPGGRAAGMDPATKKALLTRLRRIEGQVRGLQKMIEQERWCADVLVQISSVQEALRGSARELLRHHLAFCAAAAVRSGDAERTDAVFDEVVELMFRSAR
jgi:DNA-binding FrmR family transcriptional regulator